MASVISRSRKGARQKELIEIAGTGIRIPPFEVDIEAFQIRGTGSLASQNGSAKIRNESYQSSDGTVRVQLTHVQGPSAVRGSGNLSQRIAADSARQLLQLNPEGALAIRCSREIQRGGLSDNNGAVRRKETALRLVHRGRNGVEALGHMYHRHIGQLRYEPIRWSIES
jgi:hypothetical protein